MEVDERRVLRSTCHRNGQCTEAVRRPRRGLVHFAGNRVATSWLLQGGKPAAARPRSAHRKTHRTQAGRASGRSTDALASRSSAASRHRAAPIAPRDVRPCHLLLDRARSSRLRARKSSRPLGRRRASSDPSRPYARFATPLRTAGAMTAATPRRLRLDPRRVADRCLLSSSTARPRRCALTLLATMSVFLLAHVWSSILGDRIHTGSALGHPPHACRSRARNGRSSRPTFGPVVVLVLGWAGVWSDHSRGAARARRLPRPALRVGFRVGRKAYHTWGSRRSPVS